MDVEHLMRTPLMGDVNGRRGHKCYQTSDRAGLPEYSSTFRVWWTNIMTHFAIQCYTLGMDSCVNVGGIPKRYFAQLSLPERSVQPSLPTICWASCKQSSWLCDFDGIIHCIGITELLCMTMGMTCCALLYWLGKTTHRTYHALHSAC